MDKVTFDVSLREGVQEGEFMRFEPGAPISGVVHLIANEDIKSRGASFRLQWRTEGRGDLNSESLGQTEMWQGNLQKGRPIQKEFHFQLPQQPWSYSGHYISIVWEVFVYVDMPMAGDLKFARRFVVRPGEGR
jgi:hypothetical protein